MPTEIFITTPCLNAVGTIDQTIHSVVSQAGSFRLRYHIQDGGSSDGTWERILWWQEMFAQRGWPTACTELQFSCHQAPDAGLYDAIVTGFAALDPSEQGFLSWINADDIYLPGTFAFVAAADRQFPADAVSWVGGSVSVIRDDMVVASHDREIPTRVIRAGLCDDAHWHFVQQEGSFFRGWLWRQVSPEETIRPMKLAGDWNLWRRMAEHAEFVQAGRPLASFRVRPDQLSATQAEAYRAEIDAILPHSTRWQAFEDIASGPAPTRLRLESGFAAEALVLVEEAVDGRAYTRFPEAFGDAPFHPMRRVRMEGRPDHPPASSDYRPAVSPAAADRLRHVRRDGWLQALDTGWQYPAITEEHALRRLEAMGGLPDGLVYVAYPWATLIDHLQADGADAEIQMEVFEAFCAGLPTEGLKITTCQHVLLRDFLHLFRKAGIDHVFWSHTTQSDLKSEGPCLHPFPLYPVQLADAAFRKNDGDRPLLYSFIGARADEHYLTEVRNWILDRLGDRPEGLVRGRQEWHYARIVYRHQIARVAHKRPGDLVDQDASFEFREALSRSVFALCPSGSGPNSIRLWESLGAGAIPVILSDTLVLPGDPRLWERAAVFCRETPEDVAAIPDRLAALADDPAGLAAMRRAGQQLWDLYGTAGFVTDILEMAKREHAPAAATHLSPTLRRLVRGVLAAPRPDATEAELLLALAAGPGRNSAPDTGFAANLPLQEALSRARARLGRDHPACHLSPESDPEAQTVPVSAEQSLFPGVLGAVARRLHKGPTPVDTLELARLARRRDAAIAASEMPEAAILSDHHASLYRLFLNRDEEMGVDACLARWHAGRIAEWGPAEKEEDIDWPDPDLARFSRLYGACRVLWSVTPSATAAVEALILGAIPACPALMSLDPVLPGRTGPGTIGVDLTGHTRDEAQRTVQALVPDARLAANWLSARAALRARLSDPDRLEAARRAVVEAVLSVG